MRGTIWTVVVLFVIAGVAFAAAGSTYDDAAEVRSVENESLTLDTQDAVALSAADEWSSLHTNETVLNATDGTELERGTNYTIDHENGTVLAASTADDGEDVLVTYWYDWHDETTQGVSHALDVTLGNVLGFLALIAAVGVLYSWFGRL